ncbi:MAG: Hydrolase, alpha/beta fold family, partial [uncultured Actinomycetospora sp.]
GSPDARGARRRGRRPHPHALPRVGPGGRRAGGARARQPLDEPVLRAPHARRARALAPAGPGHARLRAHPAGADRRHPRARRLGRRPRRLPRRARRRPAGAPRRLVHRRRGHRAGGPGAAGGVADVPRPGVPVRLRRHVPRRQALLARLRRLRRRSREPRVRAAPARGRPLRRRPALAAQRHERDVLARRAPGAARAGGHPGRRDPALDDLRGRLPRRRGDLGELARRRSGDARAAQRPVAEVLRLVVAAVPGREAPGALDPRRRRRRGRRRLGAGARDARRAGGGARLAGPGRVPAPADGQPDPRRARGLPRRRRARGDRGVPGVGPRPARRHRRPVGGDLLGVPRLGAL